MKANMNGLAERFKESRSEDVTPGPGAYKEHSIKFNKSYNAVFISRSKRIFETISKLKMPEIGQYESTIPLGSNKRIQKGGGNYLFRFLDLNVSKKAVFQSTTQRFTQESTLD